MSEINDSIGIDTGVLIELLGKTPLGITFDDVILKDPKLQHFYLSPLTIMELLYLSGRKLGFTEAQYQIGEFIKPFIICDEIELRIEAAKMKMAYGISIADCYSLAIGMIKSIPIYMKRESEIEILLKNVSIPVEIYFIDDL
jgi:hypothetical protein